jgi:integrase
MGRRSMTGGVVGKGGQRIQYEFRLNGVRYRPSIKAIPTEANLRRAREHLKEIQQRIRLGTFSFIGDFPDFRDLNKVFHSSPYRTCNQVFDEYLAHCESRRAKNDLSFATVTGYRKALDSVWRPKLGTLPFLKVRYSMLSKIASVHTSWGKKTYNNKLSVLRRAFEFGYRDYPTHANPAWSLKGARMRRRDVPRIDPFRIQDAEALIAAIHRDWGERQGNFHECRFFTGLRPSEQIALCVRDFDELSGTLSITKARVYGVDRNMTKTREDRVIRLCPRAWQFSNVSSISIDTSRRWDRSPTTTCSLVPTALRFEDSAISGDAGGNPPSAWASGTAPVCRASHVRQLEFDDWKESALRSPPTWAQCHHHVPNVCGVDAECPGIRYSVAVGLHSARLRNSRFAASQSIGYSLPAAWPTAVSRSASLCHVGDSSLVSSRLNDSQSSSIARSCSSKDMFCGFIRIPTLFRPSTAASVSHRARVNETPALRRF